MPDIEIVPYLFGFEQCKPVMSNFNYIVSQVTEAPTRCSYCGVRNAMAVGTCPQCGAPL